MRQVIPYLSLIILLSSCYTTHVSTMLNEPEFEKVGQVRALASFDKGNPEFQNAVSVSKKWGLISGTYQGFGGARIYNLGANYFTANSKHPNQWFSATFGASLGQNRRRSSYTIPGIGFGFHRGADTRSSFASTYIQTSYRFKHVDNIQTRNFSIVFKYEFFFFRDFSVNTYQSTGARISTYDIEQEIHNKEAHFLKLGFLHNVLEDDSKLFIQIQYGIDWVFGFKIGGIEYIRGQRNFLEEERNRNIVHPKVFPVFGNLAIGIKI